MRFLVAIALIGCKVPSLDLAGKQCPCPADYVCDPATNTCAHAITPDAPRPDGTVIDMPGTDTPPAATYRDVVIADTPISYWRFDDAGSVARDEMGMHDGTYVGTCGSASGAIAGDTSKSLMLDGTSCNVSLGDVLGFPGTAPFTIEAWMNELATTGYRVMFSKETRSTGPDDGYSLLDSSTGVYFERAVGGSTDLTPHVTHTTNQFFHVVAVYDGAALTLYVDGVAGNAVADTRSVPAISAETVIGADTSGDYFKGMLDEVAIYDHALSATRIAAHHDAGLGVLHD